MVELEEERGSASVQKSNEPETQTTNKGESEMKRRRRTSVLPVFGCLKVGSPEEGGIDMEVEFPGQRRFLPTHLVVMVNGLGGRATDWRYAAKQFLTKFPEYLIVHCSERNSSMATFDGIDVMGERLAEEVKSVAKRHPKVWRISFVSHSLGGLIARYAIACLYERDVTSEVPKENRNCQKSLGDGCGEDKFKGKIAGLEPINFITIATPHLGSRGHKQVPMFCGFHALEKLAKQTSWFFGRTGRHLFLTDKGKPPLLHQMVSDHGDLKFISALKSFKRRVAYANARNDSLVGWSTSSLRPKHELPKHVRHLQRVDKYPHIIDVSTEKFADGGESSSADKNNSIKSLSLEEEMLRALSRMSWERYDVNFRGSRQRFLAHTTIQVTNFFINSDGADVIQHIVDGFLL